VCLGRPASGDAFTHGSLSQRTELIIAGRPVVIERLSLPAASPLRMGAFGLGGRSVYGCLLATGSSQALVTDVRERVTPEAPGDLFAVTTLDGVLVCRYLGHSAAAARACLTLAWERFRHHVLGKPATAPRIWRT
jgi:urease accessory protein